MDMTAAYELEVRHYCPQAVVVFDLFHVIAKFGREVIDRVRVDEANRLRKDPQARQVVKGARWLLLRRRENLRSEDDHVRLDELLRANRHLVTVYVLRGDLSAPCGRTASPLQPADSGRAGTARSSGISTAAVGLHNARYLTSRQLANIGNPDYSMSMARTSTMPPLAELQRRLRPFCEKHHIRRLEIFGSAAHGQTTPGSDVDLLVTLDESIPVSTAALLDIAGEAEELVGAPVDFVLRPSLEKSPNRFAREHILSTAVCIYGS